MTLFHVLPLVGLMVGGMFGAMLGSKFGNAAGVEGAIFGGIAGFVLGRVPFVLVLKSIRKDYSKKTVEDLRQMLRDPAFLAPNTVLLELRARGENLEPHLPIVLEMLTASSRDRRVRGWHALASGFPERAKLITDYRVDDDPEECRKKIEQLRPTHCL